LKELEQAMHIQIKTSFIDNKIVVFCTN